MPPASFIPAWSDDEGLGRVRDVFARAFPGDRDPAPVAASAPGRVNLIGEHTDYNAGLCLPIALPHRTFVSARARADEEIHLVSDQEEGPWRGHLADLAPGAVRGWGAYVAGVAWALRQEGVAVPGFDLAVASCVPYGAGLSSSAALGCATVLALAGVTGAGWSGPDLDSDAGRAWAAQVCVRAENEIAGAPTGGMDQAAALRCRAGHGLLLDNRDWSVHQVPFDLDGAGLQLLVIDTRAPHALVDGQYADRRASCEAAARILGVSALREVDPAGLDRALAALPDPVMGARVRHVVTEIDRVRRFVELLPRNRWPQVGAVMDASHTSLARDYEVSSPELDTAVAAARAAGALGARMTGGGFGGSAIALVPGGMAEQVAAAVHEAFEAAGHGEPAFLIAHAAAPARTHAS